MSISPRPREAVSSVQTRGTLAHRRHWKIRPQGPGPRRPQASSYGRSGV